MLLALLVREGLESRNILEQRQHPLGEAPAGKLVARLVTHNLYQLIDLVMAEPVDVRCPLLLHADTVRNCERGRQRRLQ